MKITENIRQRPLISLTPLIDVVFILLVFFMLASSFVEWKFIELGVGEPESLPINLAQQSLITVDFDKQYTLNEEPLPLAAIVTAVKEQLRQQLVHPVLIKPAKDLPLQQLVRVLDALGEVAGPNISLVNDET